MTSMTRRCILCASILSTGLGAQAALERLNGTDRPPLRRPLESLPLDLPGWAGHDEPMDPEILRQAQTTEHVNRVYESKSRPGVRFALWLNYSAKGDNLRHTPEVCLPSGGWTKIEAQERVLQVACDGSAPTAVSRLAYGKNDMVKHIGFWYYIFGEGKLEEFVRRLPITSRSSYGRTTWGSSITVEVFYPGEADPDARALEEFSRELLTALDPILPAERAGFHVP